MKKPSLSSLPVGPQPIDTGTAELRRVDDALVLLVNGAESSCYHLSDPTNLDFEYMQHMDAVVDAIFPAGRPLSALHLGGAGCSLARAWAAKRPGGRARVVEIDGKLTQLVRQWFDLPRSPEVAIRVGDAARVPQTLADGSFDVIVRDVFTGVSTPPAVASLEATRQYARLLAPGGVYLANVASAPGIQWAASEFATISAVFPHVLAIAPQQVARGSRRGNMVLAASALEMPREQIEVALRRLPLPVPVLGRKFTQKMLAAPLIETGKPEGSATV